MAFFFASRAAAKAGRKHDPGQEELNRIYRRRCQREQAERDHLEMKAAIADYDRSFD